MKPLQTAASIVLCLASATWAASNIDPAHKYTWSENAGWMNWHDAGAPPAAQGVRAEATYLSGFIWMENAGWVNVGDGTPANGVSYANANGSDFGVNISAVGNLTGLAWGENIGWINLAGGATLTPPLPVYLDCEGKLHGFAWSENMGWINFTEAETGKYLAVNAITVPRPCDMNHDGTPNGRDVQAFTDALLTGGAEWPDVCSGDTDADGTLDIGDVPAFVSCMLN